tara:strand:+ start:63 stop:1988 length:1926 start_codon:yes stop_codon:yes gene_type:complete
LDTDLQLKTYIEASARVNRRLGLIAFAEWVKRGHIAFGISSIVSVFLLRLVLKWESREFVPVLILFSLWMLIGGALILRQIPTVLDSLKALDRSGAWKDRFASAWFFLNQDARTVAEELHIERSRKTLSKALSEFPAVTPLPRLQTAWVFPLIAFAFAMTPVFRPSPNSANYILSDEMVEAAADQAAEINRGVKQLDAVSSLTKVEQNELERLRNDMVQMAGQLGEAEGLTTGEVLESLEARARAAERLAKKVRGDGEAWASIAMIEAMSKRPDTFDFSIALRKKDAVAVVEEATKMKRILEDEALPSEAEERLGRALLGIESSREEADKARPIGVRFGNASTKLKAAQPREAAREFEELAKHYRLILDRDQAREKLDGLAAMMREAGGEISGKQLEAMGEANNSGSEKRAFPEGLRGLDKGDLAQKLSGMTDSQSLENGGSILPGTPGGDGEIKAPPVPGTDPSISQDEGSTQQALKAPIPGEGDPNGSGGALAANDRGDQGGGKSLAAPIPGIAPSEDGIGSSAGPSGQPPGSSNIFGQGGDQAGTGSAELVDSKTDLFEAKNDSRVTAQIKEDGESTFRAVEGEISQEAATRRRRNLASEFLAVEEQALDERSLPLSRRQHVLRYFSAVREQFEREGD